MAHARQPKNQVRQRRTEYGWTQAQLAERAGISRTAVTAIEGGRLVPSVAAALALADALGSTVEQLFAHKSTTENPEVWAWEPRPSPTCFWRAEFGSRTVLYPAGSTPMLTPLPDVAAASPSDANETLVIACCDPAAGLLASRFAGATGLRLLVIPRSSRQALEMLRSGLVHMAGLHLTTEDEPERNVQVVRETLGQGTNWCGWHAGWRESPSVPRKNCDP